MFGFGEGRPKPVVVQEVSKGEEGIRPEELRNKLSKLLNVGPEATWPELEAQYMRAEDALENNPGAKLSEEEKTALHKLAQAVREMNRDAELRKAA
jgi:hypothetical protein